jgi:uncharacterized protein (TIGR02285 family)
MKALEIQVTLVSPAMGGGRIIVAMAGQGLLGASPIRQLAKKHPNRVLLRTAAMTGPRVRAHKACRLPVGLKSGYPAVKQVCHVHLKVEKGAGAIMGMHLSRLVRLAVTMAGLAAPMAPAMAEDNAVIWLLPDYPPVTISHGPRQGTGYADIFLAYLSERTPEYAHRRESSSMSRVFGLMRQGQPVCHPSLLKTPEREAFVDFSGPVEFVLPHHIVVRSDRVARFSPYRDASGAVDVTRLMQDPALVTTYQEKRGYPPVVSAALKAGAGKTHIIETSADDEGPFRQLAAGWVDYIVAYPDEVNWFAERLNLADTARFEYLPIAGSAEYVIGHVGCTKGEWGRRIVERVDQVVAKAGPRPIWVEAEARLLDPVAARRFEEVFARNSPFRPR